MIGNVYSGGSLDRAALTRRDPVALQGLLGHPDSRFIPVWRSQSLILRHQDRIDAVHLPKAIPAETVIFLGLLDGRACFALDLVGEEAPALGEFADLRTLGPLMSRDEAALLAYARGMAHWHRTHQFCG